MPIQPGTRVQIRLGEPLVALKAGEAGSLWALSSADSIAITPQTETLRIARTGTSGVSASGAGSIASGGSIAFASTGSTPVTEAPQPDEDYEYTVYAPVGTVVDFLDRNEQVVSTTTVS